MKNEAEGVDEVRVLPSVEEGPVEKTPMALTAGGAALTAAVAVVAGDAVAAAATVEGAVDLQLDAPAVVRLGRCRARQDLRVPGSH